MGSDPNVEVYGIIWDLTGVLYLFRLPYRYTSLRWPILRTVGFGKFA